VNGSPNPVDGSPNPVDSSPSGGGAMDGAVSIALRQRRRGRVLPRKTLMSKSGRTPDFDTPACCNYSLPLAEKMIL
jgi:hypothetical protein